MLAESKPSESRRLGTPWQFDKRSPATAKPARYFQLKHTASLIPPSRLNTMPLWPDSTLKIQLEPAYRRPRPAAPRPRARADDIWHSQVTKSRWRFRPKLLCRVMLCRVKLCRRARKKHGNVANLESTKQLRTSENVALMVTSAGECRLWW